MLNLSSSRQRAISRRSLVLVLLAILLAVACLLLPVHMWGGHPGADAAKAAGAPPEAATRPNPPTEPLRVPEPPASKG